MIPFEGKGCKRPIIEVSIPTDQEIEGLAKSLYQEGMKYTGLHFGWPVEYQPVQESEEDPKFRCATPADFRIGIRNLWAVHLHLFSDSPFLWMRFIRNLMS